MEELTVDSSQSKGLGSVYLGSDTAGSVPVPTVDC
jgi:hypothetical protein